MISIADSDPHLPHLAASSTHRDTGSTSSPTRPCPCQPNLTLLLLVNLEVLLLLVGGTKMGVER